MAGTRAGGLKAYQTNLQKYGPDFYKRIAAEGGKKGHTGGFASELVGDDGLTGYERARIAGQKGGMRSSRAGVKNGEGKTSYRYKKSV